MYEATREKEKEKEKKGKKKRRSYLKLAKLDGDAIKYGVNKTLWFAGGGELLFILLPPRTL